jgi:ATP phosphoribosyltransferase regulatory subunit HisZ
MLMAEKLIQSYVKDKWFVSTMYRQTSAAFASELWYYETMVWNWNAETREREPNFIAQYDSGLTEKAAMEHHMRVCALLPVTPNDE